MDERVKDIEVCQDMLKRLEETKQIYIVGLDVPISVTKGLFSLLDGKRREIARQKGIPEEQFDLEDLLGYFVGLTSSKGSPSGEERRRDILGRTWHGKGEHPQEITMDEIKKLVDEVPDVNDPAKINYWVAKDDILIYLEGWSDDCLAGTGFPLMAEGNHENKINYIKDLTPGILKRKAEEKGLRLIKGGFMETEGATNLYGVTYGVYRKPSDQTDERTRDILRRAGYRA